VRRTNKLKAAGALALAAAFLVPVGATYANWRDSAPVSSSSDLNTINVGHLFLNHNPLVTWQITSGDTVIAAAQGAVPVSQTIRDGQTLTATAPLRAEIAGNDIAAVFEVTCDELPVLPATLVGLGATVGVTVSIDDTLICTHAIAEQKTTTLHADTVTLERTADHTVTLTFSIPAGANIPSTVPGFVGDEKFTVQLGSFQATLTQVLEG